MKDNNKYPARKGIIILILFIIMVVGAYVGLIFSLFKPYYKFFIDDKFIGYYESYEDYEKHYNEIVSKTSENNYEITKYFSKEPYFEKTYVKPKYVEQFNNYTLIEENINKDYTIYKIIVNNEIQMYTKTNEKAEQIIEKIKKEVKEETDFKIEKTIVKNLNDIQTEEENEEIQKRIINANKKVTSRGSSINRKSQSYNFIWPTNSKNITSYYGARWGKTHTGIDIGIPTGSNIVATKNGKVIYSGWCGNYGYYIKIDHGNGIVSAYAHNSKLLVETGQEVNQGQIIAYSGSTGNSTGPHCHFEIIINGSFQNPLNYL